MTHAFSARPRPRLSSLAAALWLGVAAAAYAQAPAPVTPNDLVAPAATDAELPYLVPVVAPNARGAAVHDALGLLVVGHRPPAAPPAAGAPVPPHLSVFKLDAAGKPADTSTPVALPRPASLGAVANYPLFLLFHPRLPLLYVWQDALTGDPNGVAWNPAHADFDHLLIFNCATGAPVLALATCRGPEYANGNGAGAIALSADATRLYLPNLRKLPPVPAGAPPGTAPPTTPAPAAIGFLALDAQGMPANEGGKLRLTVDDASTSIGFPTATGWAPVSETVNIFDGPYGPTVWDRDNRRGRIALMTVVGNAYWPRMSAHPTQPWMYLAYSNGQPDVYRVEHVDGYVTGIPQHLTVTGSGLYGYPAVMPKAGKVAFGGTNRVHVVDLDANGRFTTKAAQAAVLNPAVEALAWSEKFGKLYVGVDKLPEKPVEKKP